MATGAETQPAQHKAGLFDIRTIIGLLLGIYGVILVITSFFTSDKQMAKADGVDVNLWTGIGLLVASAVFIAWARLRPIVVPDDPDSEGTTHH
jgi:drug/metabolite transporter (DMT)-like permease